MRRWLVASLPVVAVAAVAAAAPTGDAADSRPDPRSHELLRLDCASRLQAVEVTLFANGTLRLRERGEDGESQMWLAELVPAEVEDYRARLTAEGSPGGQRQRKGVAGEWVDQCRLTLELEAGAPFSLRYSRVDSLSLPVARLASIADELLALARERRVGSGFPPGYEVEVGDVVRRRDGSEFVVRRLTADGNGVELEGLEQPIVLYLARDQVAAEFAALVRRRR